MNEPSAAFASSEPKVKELQDLFTQCTPVAEGWDEISDNDAVRYTQWPGQSADGKKWDEEMEDGEPAFPFNGASDMRVPLADEIINEIVDYLTEAFWSAMVRVTGNPETDGDGRAAYARKLLEWMKGTKLYPELVDEIELHAQNGLAYGKSVLGVGWDRQLGYRLHEVTMQDLMALAEKAAAPQEEEGSGAALSSHPSPSIPLPLEGSGRPEQEPMSEESILVHFPEMIADPELDGDSAELLKRIYMAYVLQLKPSNYEWEPKELSTTRARQVVKELRTEGKAAVPLPYLCKNQPTVRALKMFEDVFVPRGTSHIQKAPVVIVIDWFTEADLRATAAADGWDMKWVEEAVKHKGEFSSPATAASATAHAGQESVEFVKVDASDLIEVAHAYRKQVDEDGVYGVYHTIFHLQFGTRREGDLVAKHGLQEFPIGLNYPLVQWRREVNKRGVLASRGIPQIVATWQRAVKVQEDAITDRTSFETLPPIIVPKILGVDYRFGPAVQIPVQRADQKPEFMQPPRSTPNTAFELMDRIEHRVDRYFGRRRMDEPPDSGLVKKRKLTRAFLLSCSQTLRMVLQMMVKLLPPEEIQQITGVAEPLLDDPDSIADDTSYMLAYDSQEMSPDFVAAKIKIVQEAILPGDVSGVIDRAKWVRYMLRAIDPVLEQEVTSDQAGASAALFNQVKQDFTNMALGVPANYTENDPTAPMQLQFAQQLIEVSPKYQQMLKGDQSFRGLVEQWVKNKQFSLMQMQNKQIGRLGVSPEAGN